MKIAILGSPCSGKTTLIKSLEKDRYVQNNFNKIIVVEDLARVFVEYGNLLQWGSQDGLNKIAKGYEQILTETITKKDILFSDLSSLITEFYLYRVENIKLTTIHNIYDLVFFCLPVDKQIKDKGRQFCPEEMLKINDEMLRFYESIGIDLIKLENTDLNDRKTQVINQIKSFILSKNEKDFIFLKETV